MHLLMHFFCRQSLFKTVLTTFSQSPWTRYVNLTYLRRSEGVLLFIYLFTTLFNVGQKIVTRLIKTNLTKTNSDIINKNFKIFDMQHKDSESFEHDSISF